MCGGDNVVDRVTNIDEISDITYLPSRVLEKSKRQMWLQRIAAWCEECKLVYDDDPTSANEHQENEKT
jgi:hypothetical protein